MIYLKYLGLCPDADIQHCLECSFTALQAFVKDA
jgi:hypothetical protein